MSDDAFTRMLDELVAHAERATRAQLVDAITRAARFGAETGSADRFLGFLSGNLYGKVNR